MANYGKTEMEKADIAEEQAKHFDLWHLFGAEVAADIRKRHREGDFLMSNTMKVEVKYEGLSTTYSNFPVEFENHNPKRLYRQDFRGWYYHAQEEGVEWIVYILYRTYQDTDKDGKTSTSEPEHCGAVAVQLDELVKYVDRHKEWLDKYRRYEKKNDSYFWKVPVKDILSLPSTKVYAEAKAERAIAHLINSGKVELEVMPPRKHD